MSKKLFSSLYQYTAWANGELFALLQSVPEASHRKEMHIAARILNHVFVVDQIFRANIVAEKHSFAELNTEETPKLSDYSCTQALTLPQSHHRSEIEGR